MKSKDKGKKYIKVTLKNIIICCSFAIIILCCISFYNYYFNKNEVYAKETNNIKTDNIKISNAQLMNLDEIVNNNTQNKQKEEYITEEVELEYITIYQTNSNLSKGVIQVIQEGREGKQQITKKKTYENGEIISEEQVNSKITKAAVNKIVEVGTNNYKSNYKVKIGDVVYVTSDRAEVMTEPNENTQKVATLVKGKELKIISIQNDWYKISSSDVTGYVKIENTTYINKDNENEQETNISNSSNSILKPSFGMALNKPSGLSLEQFKKVLNDSKDTNKIFANNAEYFYYIEKEYNINGVFVAAIGIHESAWGKSNIAKNKKNLFGYRAYDSDPYNSASTFNTYAEGIDLIARVLTKYYLNPKGTEIYNGETAVGTYYNGSTVTAVNKKYASDSGWANKVYSYMEYLYKKI